MPHVLINFVKSSTKFQEGFDQIDESYFLRCEELNQARGKCKEIIFVKIQQLKFKDIFDLT
jgi:hypothetical protein